jgi:lipopolysaccharide/colanic/teichoic acid biosynthesis glycosyltransferase/endonuclease/exonuclease/phosphatase family metal-dependent hydrolase
MALPKAGTIRINKVKRRLSDTILLYMLNRLTALILLIVLWPVFLIIGLLVWLFSGWPVLYFQKRSGLLGKEFWIIKFRTMRVDADKTKKRCEYLNEADGPVFKIRNDPRLTGIGKFLSHSGLDELPQLINVVRGEMELVGPRPLPVEESKKIDKKYLSVRESVKPGIISLWVLGGYHKISFEEWMKSDMKYIKNKTGWGDVVIVIRGVGMLLKLVMVETGKLCQKGSWLLVLIVWLFNPVVVKAEELKIFNQNVHGLPPHVNQRLAKIIERAKEEQSDLVLLQEIVLKMSLDKVDLSEYTPVYFNRPWGIVDGDLVILVKDDLNKKVEGEFVRYKNQGKWWWLILPDRWYARGYLRLCWKDRDFCVINTHLTAKYISWMNFKLQEEQLKQIVEENKNKRVIIMGDYNLRSLDKFRDMVNLSGKLGSSMVGHDIKIDHVLTNIRELENTAEVGYVDYTDWVSDHKGMVLNLIY